jgi:hypothetical protein
LFEVPDGSTAATLTNISLFISPKEKEGKKTTRKKKRAFDYATRRTRERREKNRTRDKMSGNTDVEKGNFAVKAGLAQVRDSHRKELERARARFFFGFSFLSRRRRHRLCGVTSLFCVLSQDSYSVRRQRRGVESKRERD